MEIIVIDPFKSTEPHFKEIGIVSAYKSLVWDVHLYGRGGFDMVVPATTENLNLLKLDRFLCRDKDIATNGSSTFYENVMVIRNYDITWDPDEGYMLHISGYTLKDVLNQRIIWNQISKENVHLTELIADIMYQNIVDPVQYVDDLLTDITEDLNEASAERASADLAYQAAVEQYGEDSPEAKAAKETLDYWTAEETRLETEWTNEVENKANQNGRAIPYFMSAMIWPMGTVDPVFESIQLHGEQICDWLESIATEYGFGWEMSLSDSAINLGAVIGSDRSDTVIFSKDYDNLINSTSHYTSEGYYNGGQVGGEGEGLAQIKVKVGTRTGYSRYEMYIDGSGVSENAGAISRTKYKQMLKQFGNTEIQKHLKWKYIEGDIDPNGMFKLGTDFFLGDIVRIESELGISGNVRLVEVIESEDETGTQIVATFEEED